MQCIEIGTQGASMKLPLLEHGGVQIKCNELLGGFQWVVETGNVSMGNSWNSSIHGWQAVQYQMMRYQEKESCSHFYECKNTLHMHTRFNGDLTLDIAIDVT